ncbi:bile acid:sodium symporter family protein [Aeromicrobium sp. CF3.5]|uniref:bile acid:sodium symporter family protein n=1 Tax=Aeromicrobium sp. CF3.5 TaxID=3373078 RepID=UPI003EE4E9D1
MDSALSSIGLPVALAIVMFGLGLALTVEDFRRTAREPKAVALALGTQLLILPLMCFGLIILLDPPPALAVGMMLLAASPGGTTANLFSHLFHGDVALNISLTAVNSVIAVITLPIVVNLSTDYFRPDADGDVGLQFAKMVQVFAIVLIPVVLGMIVRSRSSAFAARADRPVRILSIVILVAVVVGAIVAERANVADYLTDIGILTSVFCALSLTVGYLLPRAAGVSERQSLSTAFEVGIHNGTLAITVALSVLDEKQLAVPAAVYSLVMVPLATVAGLLITRKTRLSPQGERTQRS